MRDRIYITISDVNSTKHYTINQLIKRYLLYFTGFVACCIIILGGTTYFLSKKLEQYKYYKIENVKLSQEIASKEESISNMVLKLDEIEKIVVGKRAPEEENSSVEQKLIVIKATAQEKNRMLKMIPSGSPIAGKFQYSSMFGDRENPMGEGEKFHWGVDYRTDIGTNVLATSSGVVEYAGTNGAYGKMIILDNGYGFKTIYAHLSEIGVKEGEFIDKSDIIAKSGNTGRSTGPHLHYEVHFLGKRLNPLNFEQWNLKNYDNIFAKERNIKWESLIKTVKNQELQMASQQ